MNLSGKIAIVSGASSGIGKEIAKIYRLHGAKVIGFYNSKNILELEEDLKGKIDFYKVDISNTKECEYIYKKIIEKYKKVDILVNCAGITSDALTKNMTEEQFDDVLKVNLKGVWNLTRLVGPQMQKNKEGCIINISSIVGEYGNIGQVNYSATKAGIIGMTKTWAKEFAMNNENVRVNAISPGYTMTNMLKTVPKELIEIYKKQTILGRLAEPSEIANVALFLASELSSYITGTVIEVNGGMRL